ncbi:hypothetical protein [Rhizobium sp. RU20A]|uniref:hypothetical protein n=1 Tax=Rhizobium sp. RU20A TaxID=1907412 RepID=UPI00122C81EB|nr:hypothetical protein [Rhizobium sp. RU20A]
MRIDNGSVARPLPLPSKRGLSRVEAAEYIGIGATKFDALVIDGRMPQPKRIDGRKIWDLRALDLAFEQLPSANADDHNPWDS